MLTQRPDFFLERGIQRPCSNIPRETEVLVVGAGPAGSTAALHLAKQGYQVLLLDRYPFPRDKVCGDGLLTDAFPLMERAGILTQVRSLAHISTEAICYSPRLTEVRVPMELWGLQRHHLDSLLAQSAQQNGALFCQGKVLRVQQDAPMNLGMLCWVEDLPWPIHTQILLLATGAQLGLARQIGLLSGARPTGAGIRCYVRSKKILSHPVFSYERDMGPGYGWMFPLGDGLYNVGCGVSFRTDLGPRRNLREAFRDFVQHAPAVKEVINEQVERTSLLGAMMRCGLQGLTLRNESAALALGDTLGAALPFSGEGVSKAMLTGEIGAVCSHEALETRRIDPLLQYPDRIQAYLGPQCRSYQVLENLIAKPWLSEVGAHIANRSVTVRRVMTKIVAQELDPLYVLNARNILRYLRSKI